ncbi:unnamed protein product [Allacma fusca]|uniref:Tetraspanin family protein n=1 Tax=Allacma fusca TaxID=39272 RepID=A0A8J2K599_9HEXA|nr:unnamed protein product [Allacma fusca]
MGLRNASMILRIAVIVVLAINAVFTLVMLGHSIFVYNYFQGPPPTEDFRIGQIVLTTSLIIAIVAIVYALFVKLFDFKSLIVVIIIDVGFVLAIILSIASMYYFRDTQPTVDQFQNYAKAYFKKHGKSPPFFNKIQHEMRGYCCGASSYLDYVEETQYVDTDDIMAVLLEVTRVDSPEFITTNYQAMLYDREANIKKNMSTERYKRLQRQEQLVDPYLDTSEIAAKISQRISREAVDDLRELQNQFADPKMIMFLPIGCLDFMDEIKTSKWKGFHKFKFVRTHVISTFQGILGMIICSFILLIISVVIFNVKGHAIDKEQRLTAFQILHDEKINADESHFSFENNNELSTSADEFLMRATSRFDGINYAIK